MAFGIRRGWTITPRRDEDDREETRQRRLLGQELARWGARERPAAAPLAPPQEDEGPIRLPRRGLLELGAPRPDRSGPRPPQESRALDAQERAFRAIPRWEAAQERIIQGLTPEEQQALRDIGFSPRIGISGDTARAAGPEYGDPIAQTLLMPRQLMGEVDETLLREELSHQLQRGLDTGAEHQRMGLAGGFQPPARKRSPLAEGFAPESPLLRQREAFGGEPPGAARARQFGDALGRLAPQDRARVGAIARELDRRGLTTQDLVRMAPDEIAEFRQRVEGPYAGMGPGVRLDPNVPLHPGAQPSAATQLAAAQAGEPSTAQIFGFGRDQPARRSLPGLAFTSLLPEPVAEQVTRSLPGEVEGPASRALEFATSPAGIASVGVAPAATAWGLLGQTSLGTVGEALDVPPAVQVVLEAAGGLVYGVPRLGAVRDFWKRLGQPRTAEEASRALRIAEEAPIAPGVVEQAGPGVVTPERGISAPEAVPQALPRPISESFVPPKAKILEDVSDGGSRMVTVERDGVQMAFSPNALTNQLFVDIKLAPKIAPNVRNLVTVRRMLQETVAQNPGVRVEAMFANRHLRDVAVKMGAQEEGGRYIISGAQRIGLPAEESRSFLRGQGFLNDEQYTKQQIRWMLDDIDQRGIPRDFTVGTERTLREAGIKYTGRPPADVVADMRRAAREGVRPPARGADEFVRQRGAVSEPVGSPPAGSISEAAQGAPARSWQMTQQEFVNQTALGRGAIRGRVIGGGEMDFAQQLRDVHRQHVEVALQNGESIPDRVLADYPDLRPSTAPAFGSRPPPQFGTTQREFLGEQGGIQGRMFTPEETGQRGQIGLEDVVTPERPASKLGIDFERSRQSLAAERELIDEELALPRLTKGRRAEVVARGRELDAEATIFDSVERSDPETIIPLLRNELDGLEAEMRRRGIPFGGRAGLSPAAAARQARRGVGTTVPYASGETAELAARHSAISKLLPDLEEMATQAGFDVRPLDLGMTAAARERMGSRLAGMIDPVAGGGPLSAQRPAPVRTPGATSAIGERIGNIGRGIDNLFNRAVNSPPGEIASTAYGKTHGQMQAHFDELELWARDAYRASRQSGLRLTRRETPASQDLMEWVSDRAAIGAMPPRNRPLATKLDEVLNIEEQEMLAADPDFRLLGDEDNPYFPFQFKPARPGARKALGAKPGFTRRRTLRGNLGEVLGRRPDLDLVTWDPVEYVAIRRAAGIRYRQQLAFREKLRASGLVHLKSKAPADWVMPDAPAFRPRAIAGQVDDAGAPLYSQPLVTPPEVAKVIEDFFGNISIFSRNPGLRALRTGVQEAKFVKTFGGLFQHFDFNFRQMYKATGAGRPWEAVPAMARTWSRAFSDGAHEAMLRAELADPIRRAGIDNGLNISGTVDIVGDAIKMSIPKGRERLPFVDSAWDFLNSTNYRRMHRESMLSAYEIEVRDLMRQGKTLEDAAPEAVRRVNEQMSAIPNWQSVIRSPTMRDATRTLGLFSMGETEGWFRNFFRLATNPKQAGKFWAGTMLSTLAWANFINFLSTGKMLDKEALIPFEYSKDDRSGLPFLDYNTRFMRPELPWKGPGGRLQYLDLLGQADTPFRWIFDPVFAAKTRLGQLPGTALQLAQGEKFMGEPITRSGLPRYGFEQLAPIPATGAIGPELGRIGPFGAGVQAVGFNVSAERRNLSFARQYQQKHGFPPQPGLSPMVADEELARSLGYGESEFGRERAGILGETEEPFLRELAGIVLTGKPEAMEQFGIELSDFFKVRSGITETLVSKLGLPEREGELVQEYYDLDPRDRRDPETGKPLWDVFDQRQARVLAKLRAEGPSGREAATALERGTGFEFADPSLQRTYTAYQTLRDGLDAYYDKGSGKPREAYRRGHPAVDAQLYLLGETTRVMSARAQREVRTLSRELLGIEVEAGLGEQRGGLGGAPIRIGGVEPIRIGR